MIDHRTPIRRAAAAIRKPIPDRHQLEDALDDLHIAWMQINDHHPEQRTALASLDRWRRQAARRLAEINNLEFIL